jgi:hypothetical protein
MALMVKSDYLISVLTLGLPFRFNLIDLYRQIIAIDWHKIQNRIYRKNQRQFEHHCKSTKKYLKIHRDLKQNHNQETK